MENLTNNIESQLIDWAKETVNAYNRTKACFYTQSPLDQIKKDNIELLVVGINPGSPKKSFDELLNNDKCVWKDLLTKEGMTPEIFLKGNPSYVDMRKKERDGTINREERWRYWDNLWA